MQEAGEEAWPLNGTYVLPSLLTAEANFRPREMQKWVLDNVWLWGSTAAVYVLLAQLGQRWMRGRRPMQLQWALIVWNWTLAAFSVAGTVRMAPDMVYVLRHYGYRRTVCDPRMTDELAAVSFWGFLFAVSKSVEMLDTAFVVLRKHPLTWLHCLHHAFTFLGVCYLGARDFGVCRWFAVCNFAVHVLMYSYFALKAMHVRLPEAVAKTITLLQLLQMVTGLGVTLAVWALHWWDRPCSGLDVGQCILYSVAMYAVYLVLFANFYRHRYSATRVKLRRD